jgi:ubiquinone/menaquinone biosynthesis C-methylase UbiE
MSTFDPIKYKAMEKEAYSNYAASYEEYGSAIFEALAAPLLDKAHLVPGQAVLDVACGIGIPALRAAGMVAPGGQVTGIDIASGMIELARARALKSGINNVNFREGDAESLPFPDESFDAVLSNMGLIHVPDRAKALREMARVLKKSGCLALSVWSTPDKSVSLGILAKVIAGLWPAAVVPGAPTWFDFGPFGALEEALSKAGFVDVTVERIDFPLEMESSDRFWEASLGISGKLRMLLKSIPSEIAQKIEHDAKEKAEQFRVGSILHIPCEELTALARKG